MEWIPFYSAFKFVLMVWLLFPRTKGATVFFESVLIPQTTSIWHVWKKMVSFSQTMILDFVFIISCWTECVTREGYRRNRDESMLTLKQALPDDKQRVALLDDILKEYTLQSDPTGNWTEDY
ncbi:hypothetical protein BASA81_004905 [Batrachochytrium salamandrivorans]|nr:hypothetical protein BASA81_004905 [Batrachochytrium salamandrivorans]